MVCNFCLILCQLIRNERGYFSLLMLHKFDLADCSFPWLSITPIVKESNENLVWIKDEHNPLNLEIKLQKYNWQNIISCPQGGLPLVNYILELEPRARAEVSFYFYKLFSDFLNIWIICLILGSYEPTRTCKNLIWT